MNLLTNKKSALLVLSTAAILAMTGCSDDCDDCDTCPAPAPSWENTAAPLATPAEAKDAMALNAIAYPILVPLYTMLDDINTTEPVSVLVADGIPEDHNCTDGNESQGQYTTTFTNVDGTRTVKYEFGTGTSGECYDVENTADIGGEVIKDCLLGIALPTGVNDVADISVYKVQYEGVVTCTRVDDVDGFVSADADLANYTVSATDNSAANEENRWTYNVVFGYSKDAAGSGHMSDLSFDGSVRGEYWSGEMDNSTLTNDETWDFKTFSLVRDTTAPDGYNNNVSLNGKVDYISPVRAGDSTYPNLDLALNFDKLSYMINGDIVAEEDANISVSGSVGADCLGGMVTYATANTGLIDINATRDSQDKRMPSDGNMTLSGNGEVTAVFGSNGKAKVTVTTADDYAVDYSSWKQVTDGSSCQAMQDIIDRMVN